MRGLRLGLSLVGGPSLSAGVFYLFDGFTFATVGDSIDVNTTRDGLIEGLQGYGYPFMGDNFAISGTEVVYKSQNNPYWDPAGAAGHGGDQFHFVSALAVKPDVLYVGGGENSFSHNDDPANIIAGYQSIIAAAKAIGCKVIIRHVSVTWGGVQLTNGRIANHATVSAGLAAMQAADPGNVLVINTDTYDHGHVGWGIGPASGVFENGNSYADGTGHPNCAQGGPRLGKLIADAIIPYVIVSDTSRWTSSGTLLQSQNLNDKWNWPTFGVVSGTGYSGNAPAGLTISNTSDVATVYSAGTGVNGIDVALVIAGSGTATVQGVDQIDVPVNTLFKAGRVYNFNVETKIGNNAGNGDAIGVYNLTAELIVGGVTIATAYTGSVWASSDLQQRNTVIRGYCTQAVAADTTGGTLRIKLFKDARLLDYKVEPARTFVRAPRQDPANLVINALAIANVYNSAQATITIERGRTVGSVTLNWSCTDGSSDTITIPIGATQGTKTFTPLSLGSHTVTISGASGSYTIGTATAAFTNTDPSATYIAALSSAGAPASGTEQTRLQTLFGSLASSGALAKMDRLFLLAGETETQALMNAVDTAKVLTKSGSGLTFTADRGYLGDGVAGTLQDANGWTYSGSKFSQNSASFGVWCNLEGASGNAKPHIGGSATAAKNILNTSSTGASETSQINGGSSTSTRTSGSRKGSRSCSRTGASACSFYFNGASVATNTTASNITSIQQPNLLRNNTTYTADRLAAFWAGSGMTDQEVLDIYNALNTYLTAKGAN